MTPHDPRFTDGDDPSSEPLASDEIQREISAMLRHVARDASGPEARMPGDVEARIRDALHAQTRSTTTGSSETPSAPSTVVPLPLARRRATVSADDTKAAPMRTTAPRPETAQFREDVKEEPAATPLNSPGASERGASVRSLESHRERTRGPGRAALALGAAAAVVIGGLGVWKGMSGSNPSAPTADGSTQVRVTNSHTPYTEGGLSTQAASLPSSASPAITSTAQAQQEGLGHLATKEGVEACVNAIAPALAAKPDKVYADFGTFDKHPAVIVMVVQGSTKKVWAVNRTCTQKGDIQAGPTTVDA